MPLRPRPSHAHRLAIVCAALPFAAALAAQAPDDDPANWNAQLQARKQAGRDLVELRYRRDAHGQFEVASCTGGAIPFAPLFAATALPTQRCAPGWAYAAALLMTTSSGGLLSATDAERHLQRIDVARDPMALRQFLLAPSAGDDADLLRVAAVDRALALDWLVRTGNRGVVAECLALARAKNTAPLLRDHAHAALAAFGKGDPVRTARRHDPATLLLPVAADAYLMVDHTRLPDPAALRRHVRRWFVDSSHRVLDMLRAPTPDDLYHGQLRVDVFDELGFEMVQRFGDAHFDHSVLAVCIQPAAAEPYPFTCHSVGSFDVAAMAAAAGRLVTQNNTTVEVATDGDGTRVVGPAAEARFDAGSLVLHGKGRRGRPQPELASTLLADGPALRAWVPKTSKLWPALAALVRLPPIDHAELTVAFSTPARLALAITARDEDAAEAWASLAKAQLATWATALPTAFADDAGRKAHAAATAAALQATRVTTDGARVEIALACTNDVLVEDALALVGNDLLRRLPQFLR